MSGAAYFLLVAFSVAVLASVAVWLMSHRPTRSRQPDFADQLQALRPPGHVRGADQPSGVGRVSPSNQDPPDPGRF